jgi:isopropylmalate/homocitrate/citramalate synthase
VSRHNFDTAIAVSPRWVQLHDLTIRDGEESADLVFSTDDKVRIVDALARFGIKPTEVFLTVAGWKEVIRAILARLGISAWTCG